MFDDKFIGGDSEKSVLAAQPRHGEYKKLRDLATPLRRGSFSLPGGCTLLPSPVLLAASILRTLECVKSTVCS